MRILLIENLESDFYISRLNYARRLVEEGWEVHALLPDEGYDRPKLSDAIIIHSWDLKRKDKSPSAILGLVLQLNRLKKTIDYNIVHSYRFQPNLINAMSNRKGGRKVMHVTGLGGVFSGTTINSIFFKHVSRLVYLYKLKRSDKLIFQNDDDPLTLFKRNSSLLSKKISVIYGSGVSVPELVHCDRFSKTDNLKFICVTRLIKEKGIMEMLEAFACHASEFPNHELWVVGGEDRDNPSSLALENLRRCKVNNVKFFGRREDVLQLMLKADIFVYPSYYREGVPRAIIEALSLGLPVITTDMPGCNLTVNSRNGILIRPKNVGDLTDAFREIGNKNLSQLGRQSRSLFYERFEAQKIYSQMLNLYES